MWELELVWSGLGWPLLRILFFISVGLFVANLIESLNWTTGVARLAAPLVRLGRLKDISGAAFSMAFFSGIAANSMLAENYDQGKLSTRELVLSNLFNSLPTYFLHLPTMFFITVPFIGAAAFLYVGLTFFSAILRTAAIVVAGRLFLPPIDEGCIPCRLEEQQNADLQSALAKTWKRFKKRIRRVVLYTAPIYVLIFTLRQYDAFGAMERFMAEHVSVLSFLPPESFSIIVFHVAAEFTAGLAAASALIETGSLGVKDIVIALLVGNILSTPMRAFRHQFPYYAGIFKPRMALVLVGCNQAVRMVSLIIVGLAYALLAP